VVSGKGDRRKGIPIRDHQGKSFFLDDDENRQMRLRWLRITFIHFPFTFGLPVYFLLSLRTLTSHLFAPPSSLVVSSTPSPGSSNSTSTTSSLHLPLPKNPPSLFPFALS
jgi:hypothetical protein